AGTRRGDTRDTGGRAGRGRAVRCAVQHVRWKRWGQRGQLVRLGRLIVTPLRFIVAVVLPLLLPIVWAEVEQQPVLRPFRRPPLLTRSALRMSQYLRVPPPRTRNKRDTPATHVPVGAGP